MPVQDFNIYTAKGYAGDLPDSTSALVTQSLTAAAEIGFGVAVGSDGNVSAGGYVYGITRRQLNHEAANRPSDGTTNYRPTETMSVLRQGYIYVEVTSQAAVAGEIANINTTTGAFAGSGTPGGGEAATTNVVYQESGTVGEIVKAWIEHQPV